MKKLYQYLSLVSLLSCIGLFAGCSFNTSPTANTKTHQSKIQLTADLTDQGAYKGEVFDFFDIAVRTQNGSPHSVPATFGRRPKVNTVRMLGGWASQNVEADTYKWDGEKYVYDFKQATDRIDKWLNNDWDIFQIVLDNPPWAFQRDFKLVEQPDGIHYLKKDALGVYGNSLPPADSKAWNLYIQAFVRHLVKTYGQDMVQNWRFRVGSEIDTRPQHWSASRETFFEHYKNTVTAVHTVLPEAKIGAHFREASFKGQYVDYRGQTEDAYAPHFIAWAKQNKVPYDFVAISYYPHIDKPHELDMQAVYEHDIAPIQLHPDWNKNATLEIHEFKFIIKMKRAGFDSVKTSHASAFFAMLSKMMLEKNITDVYQWGNANGGRYIPEAMTQLALHSMIGKQRYSNSVSGEPSIKDNEINGIFTQNAEQSVIEILLYNFNKNNLTYQLPEMVQIAIENLKPAGQTYQYRTANIDRTNNQDQMFAAEFPKAEQAESEGGWRKADAHLAHATKNTLNKAGTQVYLQNRHKYQASNQLQWSSWQTAKTQKTDNQNSNIIINTELPSFSVQKVQIKFNH